MGLGGVVEEYDTYVLYINTAATPNAIATQLLETKRKEARVVLKRRLLIAALLGLLVWLAVFTALGAALGWAFGGAGLRCENLELMWYSDTDADCETVFVLPQSGGEQAQRTVHCVTRAVGDGTIIGQSVEILSATGASVNSGFGVIWPSQIVRFDKDAEQADLLKGATLSITGVGVRFQGNVNSTLAVQGGVSGVGPALSGFCSVYSVADNPTLFTYELRLAAC